MGGTNTISCQATKWFSCLLVHVVRTGRAQAAGGQNIQSLSPALTGQSVFSWELTGLPAALCMLQGNAEKALGLPVSPLFDRDNPGVTKSQVGS